MLRNIFPDEPAVSDQDSNNEEQDNPGGDSPERQLACQGGALSAVFPVCTLAVRFLLTSPSLSANATTAHCTTGAFFAEFLPRGVATFKEVRVGRADTRHVSVCRCNPLP